MRAFRGRAVLVSFLLSSSPSISGEDAPRPTDDKTLSSLQTSAAENSLALSDAGQRTYEAFKAAGVVLATPIENFVRSFGSLDRQSQKAIEAFAEHSRVPEGGPPTSTLTSEMVAGSVSAAASLGPGMGAMLNPSVALIDGLSGPLADAAIKTPPDAALRAADSLPENMPAQQMAAVSLKSAGRLEEARSLYERVLRSEPSSPGGWTGYADLAYRLNDMVLAHHAAAKALALSPDNPVAFSILKLTESKVPSLKDSPPLKAAPKTAEEPSSYDGFPEADGGKDLPAEKKERLLASRRLVEQAVRALKAGELESAEDASRRALGLAPENLRARNHLATTLNRLGRHDEALAEAETVLARAPDAVPALLNRSLAEIMLGRYEEGSAGARAALSRSPSNPVALRLLAHAQAGLKDRRGMIETLAKGALLDPSLERLHRKALQLPESSEGLLLFEDAKKEPSLDPDPEAEDGPPFLMGLAILMAIVGLLALLRFRRRAS